MLSQLQVSLGHQSCTLLCLVSSVTEAPFTGRTTREVWGPRWAGGVCLRATKMCAVVLGSQMGLRMVFQLSADFQALYLFYKLSKLSVSKDSNWPNGKEGEIIYCSPEYCCAPQISQCCSIMIVWNASVQKNVFVHESLILFFSTFCMGRARINYSDKWNNLKNQKKTPPAPTCAHIHMPEHLEKIRTRQEYVIHPVTVLPVSNVFSSVLSWAWWTFTCSLTHNKALLHAFI